MCLIQILDWTCTICGKGGVDEDVESNIYCPKANLPGHRQTCHEITVSEDVVCKVCDALVDREYYRMGRDQTGSAGLMAVGGAIASVDGIWDTAKNQWTQEGVSNEGASKEGVQKKSKKARWNAGKKAKAAAATNAKDDTGLAQSSAEMNVSGLAGEEPSALVRSETDGKASTSLNGEASVFVPGAWRHGA